jgi:mono/diheme cytochrome c family protein
MTYQKLVLLSCISFSLLLSGCEPSSGVLINSPSTPIVDNDSGSAADNNAETPNTDNNSDTPNNQNSNPDSDPLEDQNSNSDSDPLEDQNSNSDSDPLEDQNSNPNSEPSDNNTPNSLPSGSMAEHYPESVLCPTPQATEVSIDFASKCANCHGINGLGLGDFPAIPGQLSLDDFISVVRLGRNNMPAFDEENIATSDLQADFAALTSGSFTVIDNTDCGPGTLHLGKDSNDLESRLSTGLAAFHNPGNKGSCANCHSAVGLDLAMIGFSDGAILRRALPNVDEDTAHQIVDYIHALRQKFNVDRPLHPKKFRFGQPGFEVIGDLNMSESDRDKAFGEYLLAGPLPFITPQPDQHLLVADPVNRIDSLAKAKAANKQLLNIDLTKLKIATPFNLWTQDGFHGDEQMNANEWIAMQAHIPKNPGEHFALAEAYLQNPTEQNLWAMYDPMLYKERDGFKVRSPTPQGNTISAFELWQERKHQSNQVASHMMLYRTELHPNRHPAGKPSDAQDKRQQAMTRSPFWRVADSVRMNPIHDNDPFPMIIEGEFRDTIKGDSYKQNKSMMQMWFWLGYIHDPALLEIQDTNETVMADYFMAAQQPYNHVQAGFLLGTIGVHKAAAKEYSNVAGEQLLGHGYWASPRPYMQFFQHRALRCGAGLHCSSNYNIDHAIWANTMRMFLFLMDEEVTQTGEVIGKTATIREVQFMAKWFGTLLEPDLDHSETQTQINGLLNKLQEAQEVSEAKGYPFVL